MFSSANFSFAIYPGLSQGAYDALARHADQRLQAIFLPRLADGSWSGTMCLTEPQCGTDLGLIRTRAVPAGDGSFRVDGTKIFISAGEHDLTENIVHLVLAKLPDAPAGTRGISLFVVPKFLPVEGRGRLGQRRAQRRPLRRHRAQDGHPRLVHLHHAVRRCRGLAGGRPAPGHGRDVHHDERRPARRRHPGAGRRRGRLPGGPGLRPGAAAGPLAGRPACPDRAADPIIVHPDVRRNLLTIKAFTEGARALAYWVGLQLDRAERHPDPAERQAADDLAALMTPIIKAFLTDLGFAATNLAMQVFGGHGYIRETGIEQYVRDARIAQIYEGANGIQALDLVGRKLGQHTGRLLRRFFHPVSACLEEAAHDPGLADLARRWPRPSPSCSRPPF